MYALWTNCITTRKTIHNCSVTAVTFDMEMFFVLPSVCGENLQVKKLINMPEKCLYPYPSGVVHRHYVDIFSSHLWWFAYLPEGIRSMVTTHTRKWITLMCPVILLLYIPRILYAVHSNLCFVGVCFRLILSNAPYLFFRGNGIIIILPRASEEANVKDLRRNHMIHWNASI